MNITDPYSTAYNLVYSMKRKYPTDYLIRSRERVKRCLEVCDVLEKPFWEAVSKEIANVKL